MYSLLQEASNAAPGFSDVVANAYATAYSEAHPSQVDDVASRVVRNAGWFKTKTGAWKQLAPDVRDKVNIRGGSKQPDGRYLVEDVDVFYPNRVKGDDDASNYTPKRVREFIANTNAAAESGGQMPAVVREHPTLGRRDRGIATPASGVGFGFKESPRGNGWARCNLLVNPDVYDEWRKGHWVGLSAGLACDKFGSNMRFGHIALLGADMQALSHLPRVEVFSSVDPQSQVCFSTDSVFLTQYAKGADMPTKVLTEDQKKAFIAMGEAQKQLSETYLAFAACDPDAETKQTAAQANFESAEALCAAAFGTSDEGNPLYDENQNTAVPEDEELNAMLAEEPPSTIEAASAGGQPSGGGGGSFSAQQFSSLQSEMKTLREENSANKTVIRALIGKNMRNEFSAFIAEKQQAGHQFDAKAMMDLFTASVANPEAVKQIKRVIETSPRDAKIVGGPTFSAEEANKAINTPNVNGNGAKAPAKGEIDSTLKMLRTAVPHMDFSADDIKLGMVAEVAD